MDDLLQPFLHATSDSARQECLDDLLLLHAMPVARSTLQLRLGLNVNQYGTNPYSQDAEDLCQEALTKIIQRLNNLKDSHAPPIQDFRSYVSRTTANVCINHLRARSPGRRRLKDRVRLMLLYHRDFAPWEVAGAFLGGFAAWQGSKGGFSEKADQRTEEDLVSALFDRYSTRAQKKAPLSQTMAELFAIQGGPIEVDMLVNVLAKILQIEDRPATSIDNDLDDDLEPPLVEPMLSDFPDVDGLELLKRLWETVQRLHHGQRDAYCFRFHDERGDDLLSLLIEARVATLPEIARVLGRSEQDLRRLLSILPMDGATAAAEMNTTKAQVHQWRFRAIERLRKELLPEG